MAQAVRSRAVLAALMAMGCGRIGFDPAVVADDIASPDDGGTTGVPAPPEIRCGETVSVTGAPIMGGSLTAMVTTRGLVALWIDPGGALRGTTWKAAPGGAIVVRDSVTIANGAHTRLWAAANGDEILLVSQDAGGATVRLLDGDLGPPHLVTPLPGLVLNGRHPIARKRTGPGFVMISAGGGQPFIMEVDQVVSLVVHVVGGLPFHTAVSIAADTTDYAVVSERPDQFNSACWSSHLDDEYAVTSGPGTLESTEQADCDSGIATDSTGPRGAAMAWMDRDPVNSYASFGVTTGAGGTASQPGEIGVGLPIGAATTTGVVAIYRSTAGLRVFDGAGVRTLSATAQLADLVTWSDRAVVLWTTATGAPQLTRLCPAPAI